MAGSTGWMNLAVAAASLAGFICLALASERQGELLLHRRPSAPQRLAFRLAAWSLLALALILSFIGWGWSIGVVAWLGWLTMAGAALTFYLPWWPWQQKQAGRARSARPSRAVRHATPGDRRLIEAVAQMRPMAVWPSWRHLVGGTLLVIAPVLFLLAAGRVDPAPVLRADAVHGQIGPWAFVLAETDRKPPVLSASGMPTKTFQIRFCPVCDADIRAVYFKVRKPRSLRAAGLAFGGSRWTRSVEIAIPPASKLRDQLWLTVEGKDGQVHHRAFDFEEVSPATATFIQEHLS